MPQIVVTQTAKEYSDYTKKKAREMLQRVIFGLVLLILMMMVIYYSLWSMVHVSGN